MDPDYAAWIAAQDTSLEERAAVDAVVSEIQDGLVGHIVGCVMRRLQGRANPERVTRLTREALKRHGLLL